MRFNSLTIDDFYTNPLEVRERLLVIAYEFIDFLDIDIVVTDIILTGSLSNYNWSKYSMPSIV